MLSPESQPDADDSSPGRPAPSPDHGQPIDAVSLYNYDHWEGHAVEVTVAPVDGDPVLRERHYLSPGESACVAGVIDPGGYQLRVLVDGVERLRDVHAIDDTPDGTAVVELGNGVVSVTGGTSGRALTR